MKLGIRLGIRRADAFYTRYEAMSVEVNTVRTWYRLADVVAMLENPDGSIQMLLRGGHALVVRGSSFEQLSDQLNREIVTRVKITAGAAG